MTTNQLIIEPYFYQVECLDILHALVLAQKTTALVVMASGLGKTITAAFHAKSHFDRKRESRCLFLCHQNDILEQAQLEFAKVLGDKVIHGFFHGGEKSAQGAQIVFASFQTMRGHLEKFDPREFDIVIVDETHHSKAPTYEKVIDYFKPEFLLGITATPDRMDGHNIRDIYGPEVYNLSLVDALARGLLCPVEYKLMTDEISLSSIIDTPHGKLGIKALNKMVFIPKRDAEIAAIIAKHMDDIAEPRVMIFCSSVEHCERVAQISPGCVPIHSKIPRGERRTRLELFRQGAFQATGTVDMFNEALDIPEANVIVFLRSTASPIVFFQQLGRGLRPHKDKSKVIILDFVGNCERVSAVYELWKTVNERRAQMMSGVAGLRKDWTEGTGVGEKIAPFSLNVETVEFKEKIMSLLDLMTRLKADFYPTCEEAAAAAKKLGIKDCVVYKTAYRNDPRLPSKPSHTYSDFPGWKQFLTGKKKYETWEEASLAAIALGIQTQAEYRRRYKKDPGLPVDPPSYYKDCPTWKIFLRQNFYPTWQDASDASKKLGIKFQKDYWSEYKKNSDLPSHPELVYQDFPGWRKFLGKK